MKRFLTVGELAARCGIQRHCVVYLIDKLLIEPVGVASGVRIFDESAIEKIQAAREASAKRIAENRAKRSRWKQATA